MGTQGGVGQAIQLRQQSDVLPKNDDKTIIVFSGDFDKVMAAFVIANGALAMGKHVTMFFTFWGIKCDS
jgi:hypothetical protein